MEYAKMAYIKYTDLNHYLNTDLNQKTPFSRCFLVGLPGFAPGSHDPQP
ncbi:MAG: hypothetical protein KKD35_03190 [Elusimicrobia bacterium]|nr:hypothetical protein [Elusimicrobiota bacterium]